MVAAEETNGAVCEKATPVQTESCQTCEPHQIQDTGVREQHTITHVECLQCVRSEFCQSRNTIVSEVHTVSEMDMPQGRWWRRPVGYCSICQVDAAFEVGIHEGRTGKEFVQGYVRQILHTAWRPSSCPGRTFGGRKRDISEPRLGTRELDSKRRSVLHELNKRSICACTGQRDRVCTVLAPGRLPNTRRNDTTEATHTQGDSAESVVVLQSQERQYRIRSVTILTNEVQKRLCLLCVKSHIAGLCVLTTYKQRAIFVVWKFPPSFPSCN